MRPIPTVSGCGDARPYMWINEVEVEDAKTHQAIMKKDHIAFTAESQSPFVAHLSFTPRFNLVRREF
jgi:hypothetical protein